MRKIGIITLTGNVNFGNKLQNYALKKKIDDITKEKTETIWLKEKKSTIFKIKRHIKRFIKSKDYKREKKISKFNELLDIKEYNNMKFANEYDNYVIGSDQVWNYNFCPYNYELFFARFSPKEKNISYAASIGVSYIDDKYTNLFKEGLDNINYISVREEKAKEIVEKISGRHDIEVLVDPTMLLTRDEWERIEKKPKHFNEKKYILTYFLGNITDEINNEILRIAKENDCTVINMMNYNDKYYVSDPCEFLWLERNAFLICTDSYHSSIFGIIFDKPFVVFERNQKGADNMMSRLDTLLSKFHLYNRKFDGCSINKNNLEHNYTEAYNILKKEREKSNAFLKNALKLKKD